MTDQLMIMAMTAPGLLALVQAMREIATVSILAPDRNWSVWRPM